MCIKTSNTQKYIKMVGENTGGEADEENSGTEEYKRKDHEQRITE